MAGRAARRAEARIAGSVLVPRARIGLPVLWQLAQFREATAVCTIAGGAVPLHY